mmetsp:Transcript_19463/g.59973  ORF Transcript_19463/g.59973 Transcript_19463/m.59973 type:complete len:81 (+) Transcript_19463:177-419(+)
MGDNQPLRTHSSLKGADFKVAPATEAQPTPSVVVDLQVQAPRTKVDEEPPVTTETFEIRPGVLDAMLEGFGKIRDQLEKV